MAKTFRILWPEKRVLSAGQIKTWYEDAIDNNEVDDRNCYRVEDMARELHQAGLITLAKE